MKHTTIIESLKKTVGKESLFSTRELIAFLKKQYPELQESTLGWKINQLKKEELIFQVGRGFYSFTQKPEFEPLLSLRSKRLYNKVKKLVPKLEICIWELGMLDQILEKETDRYLVFIAAKKEELEMLFSEMLGFSKKVFLNPNKTTIDRYVLPVEEAILLVPLVTETPLVEINDTLMPTLEGLLVNAYIKNDLILEPIGSSLEQLFRQAFKKYKVNQSKLLRYAARRDKREELHTFIQTIKKT